MTRVIDTEDLFSRPIELSASKPDLPELLLSEIVEIADQAVEKAGKNIALRSTLRPVATPSLNCPTKRDSVGITKASFHLVELASQPSFVDRKATIRPSSLLRRARSSRAQCPFGWKP